ncbi:MAG: 2-C-methyl-D-erythritol 4-phosphate cytidylyltransferase [Chloroflexota bacterium]
MAGSSKVGALIAGAGSGSRLGGVNKAFFVLRGRPLLSWVMEVFERCAAIDRIVVLLGEADVDKGGALVRESGWRKVSQVCPGGERRQDSVRLGLSWLADCEWVVIHDVARPFVTSGLISAGLEAARGYGAAVAAVAVKDTIKIASSDGTVRSTPPRDQLWAAQTPQVFRCDIIRRAYDGFRGDATDDASIVEQAGSKIRLYGGSYDNIKITTPEDVPLAEAIAGRLALC